MVLLAHNQEPLLDLNFKEYNIAKSVTFKKNISSLRTINLVKKFSRNAVISSKPLKAKPFSFSLINIK